MWLLIHYPNVIFFKRLTIINDLISFWCSGKLMLQIESLPSFADLLLTSCIIDSEIIAENLSHVNLDFSCGFVMERTRLASP